MKNRLDLWITLARWSRPLGPERSQWEYATRRGQWWYWKSNKTGLCAFFFFSKHFFSFWLFTECWLHFLRCSGPDYRGMFLPENQSCRVFCQQVTLARVTFSSTPAQKGKVDASCLVAPHGLRAALHARCQIRPSLKTHLPVQLAFHSYNELIHACVPAFSSTCCLIRTRGSI